MNYEVLSLVRDVSRDIQQNRLSQIDHAHITVKRSMMKIIFVYIHQTS